MNTRTFIHERYGKKNSRKGYRYINSYKILANYAELRILNKTSKKMVLKCFFDKDLLPRLSQYHWTTSGTRIPCSKVEGKSMTIGKFIGEPELRNFGKIIGKPIFDFRSGKLLKTGNTYHEIDNQSMKLKILKKNSRPYFVIFDKADSPLLNEHIWRVEKDSNEIYSVMTNISNKVVFMHRYLLKTNSELSGNKSFRNIRSKNNVFNFKRSVIHDNLLNYFRNINSNVIELTINSLHGLVKVLIDKEDYKKVSKISWVYKKNGKTWVIGNYKAGSLKRFILGRRGDKYRYIKTRKDTFERFDYRKKSLIKGLEVKIF